MECFLEQIVLHVNYHFTEDCQYGLLIFLYVVLTCSENAYGFVRNNFLSYPQVFVHVCVSSKEIGIGTYGGLFVLNTQQEHEEIP